MHHSLKVTLTTDQGLSRPGMLQVVEFDHATRTKRAAKAWAFCWLLALCSVVLPLLHFVLVPAFLVAGPVAAWLVFHRERLITGGESTCPKCDAPFQLSAGKVKWPLQDTCGKCHEPVWVRKAEAE